MRLSLLVLTFHNAGISSMLNPAIHGRFWIGAGANHWKPVRGPAINLGDWDHLAGTYADGNHKFYINGEFIGEENFDIDVNPSEEFLIGAGGNERPVHTYLFKGKIDEVPAL